MAPWDPTVPATGAPLLSAPIRENFQALDALMAGGGVTPAYPLLAPDGSAAAPSYAFAASADTGFYRSTAGLRIMHAGNLVGGTYALGGAPWVGFSVVHLDLGFSGDVLLARDGPGILAQKNGANAQLSRVYEDATRYLEFGSTAPNFQVLHSIGASSLQVGTTGNTQLYFLTNNIARWFIWRDGHLWANADNAYDIGTVGGRVRDLYLGTSLNFSVPTVPGTPATGEGVLYMKADKKLYFKNDAGVETALF